MTIMGQLQPGVVTVVKPGTTTVLGYAFTVEDGNGGQLQRWLLHENPHNAFEIKPAPGMTGWTLPDWKAYVQGHWTESSIYVWACADVYVHGGTYRGTPWNTIPPASALPDVNYPEVNESNLQLEYRFGLKQKVQQNESEGLVFTMGGLGEASSAKCCSSVEYWMLPASYKAAGGTHSAAVTAETSALLANGSAALTTGTEADTETDIVAELQQFIDLANKSWTTGSRFVITGCINYHGTTAPSLL